jgi:beta-lactamase class D
VRVRDVLAVLAGLLVVGAVVGGAWLWLGDTLDGDDEERPAEPGETAAATVAAYLDAWEAGDHTTMASLVRRPPEDFEERHDQLLEALAPDAVVVAARGELEEPVDGRAEQAITVSVELPELGDPISWDTDLTLLRQGGVWALDWSLASLHPELRPTWTFGKEVEELERSPILAADGTQLAGGGELVTFGFEPSAIDDPEEVAAAFEAAIPGSGDRAERELGRSDLVDGWFYPVVTVGAARADEVGPELRGVRGVLRQQATGRTLYAEGFARHVVGVVAEATAEQLEQLGDPYVVGDEVGQFGLERVFERELVGGEIVRVGLRDGAEGPLRLVLAEGHSEDAGAVQTTIDVAVQQAIENALTAVSNPTAIVVVDARDGAIRGSASRPLTAYNRAWEGRYPPGSTFKVVTAESLLAAGASPSDPVECPAETTVGGLRIPNSEGRDLGSTDLRMAFAESCNTTFARLAAEAGTQPLAEAAARFGFGVEYDLPLAAFGGSFPEPVDTAELGAAAFGQARVEASPLHVASVAAAAIAGVWHEPYLLAEDGPGESRPLGTGVREPLARLLQAVVEEGTGTDAAVDGEVVGGKTGTAQGADGVEHSWFLGTWGDLGFAVLLEDSAESEETAASLAARLVRELAVLTGGEIGEDADRSEDATAEEGDTGEDGDEPEGGDQAEDSDAESEDGDGDGSDDDGEGDATEDGDR